MTKQEAEAALSRNPIIAALLERMQEDGTIECLDLFQPFSRVEHPADANLNWVEVIKAVKT
jgi:hypothetical protein